MGSQGFQREVNKNKQTDDDDKDNHPTMTQISSIKMLQQPVYPNSADEIESADETVAFLVLVSSIFLRAIL